MNFCLNFDHGREIAQLRGELQFTKLVVQDLKEQLAAREVKLEQLMDWLLHINGAPSAFEPATPAVPQKPPNPFSGVSQAKDWVRIAESLGNQATTQQP